MKMPPWVFKHEDIHENYPWIWALNWLKKNESDGCNKNNNTQDKTLHTLMKSSQPYLQE